MTIREWVALAPEHIREELQFVTVMNFFRQHRNDRFQMIGCYDGSISDECKELMRHGYEAMNELIEALHETRRPPLTQ